MPSVAIKGGIFILATKVPEISPHSAPVAIEVRTPSNSGIPAQVRTIPVITAQNVISVPMDRLDPR